jgi:hypothetical protein
MEEFKIVCRMVKWVLVSTVVLGSMAQAESDGQGAAKNGEYSNSTVRQMPRGNFDHIYVAVTGGERKSIAVSRFPTERVLPVPKTTPPSKPNLPPLPPPKQTPPSSPPVTHSPPNPPPPMAPPPVIGLPPVPPPVTHSPTPAPEIDAHRGLSGLALLVGGLLVMRGGRSRRFSG